MPYYMLELSSNRMSYLGLKPPYKFIWQMPAPSNKQLLTNLPHPSLSHYHLFLSLSITGHHLRGAGQEPRDVPRPVDARSDVQVSQGFPSII